MSLSPVYGLVVVAIGITLMLVGWHGARGLEIKSFSELAGTASPATAGSDEEKYQEVH